MRSLEADMSASSSSAPNRDIREATPSSGPAPSSMRLSAWLLGRVVDALGNPIDGKGPIKATNASAVDVKAPAHPAQVGHEPCRPPQGHRFADPVAAPRAGHRDRQTGKTAIILDTMLTERRSRQRTRRKKLYCVYVAVGQNASTVAQFVKVLEERGALEYSIIVRRHRFRSRADAVPGAVPPAPPLREYFRDNGIMR